MRTIINVISVLIFYNSLVMSQITTDVRTGKGTGMSEQDAVNNALIDVLAQIKGIKIQSYKDNQDIVVQQIVGKNGTTEESGTATTISMQDILTEVKGRIASYDVIDSNRDGDQWKITVKAVVKGYKTPGLDHESRRKIGIYPFRSGSGKVDTGKIAILEREIVSQMTALRRFAVIDRDYMKEYSSEKNFVLSSDAQPDQVARLGEALGIDYMIVGTVEDMNLEEKEMYLAASGETVKTAKGNIVVSTRVIVMATRQIKWAKTFRKIFDASGSDSTPLAWSVELENFANQISVDIANSIYPIRIVKIMTNGQVVLGQGGSSILNSSVFGVFSMGEEMVDPYTGEKLGAVESQVATIKVIRVDPKLSYATVINGKLDGLKATELVCRKLESDSGSGDQISNPASDKYKPSEGVRLPFD